MIPSHDKDLESQLYTDYTDHPVASSSVRQGSPPPFADSESEQANHFLVQFSDIESQNNGELGPPPVFTPYEAEYFEVGFGDIVSHDQHLNTDGEALYRFLLSQAVTPPSYCLHLRGTHTETRHRWVNDRHDDGRSHTRRETYTEVVVDFEFSIDISPPRGTLPTQWSVADTEPAYRGLMTCEVEQSGGTGSRKATREEIKGFHMWLEERKAQGLPPWVGCLQELTEGRLEDSIELRSSKTMRQWADEYCSSPKYLKEFVYEKVLYGWNLHQLEAAIRTTIASTPYNGHVVVEFKTRGARVYIRPDNRLSRMLSNKWLKFLSILVFLFPFIWLFKRFHSRGGGVWQVCGGSYALKRWVPLEEDEEVQPASEFDLKLGVPGRGPCLPPSRYMETSNGTRKLIGQREGEWYRKWEGTIVRAVVGRFQGAQPLCDKDCDQVNNMRLLDGYLG